MARVSLLFLALAALPTALAHADESPLSTVAAYEYYIGPNNQFTRTLTGEVGAKIRGATASLTIGRVDDSSVGAGLDLGAGLELPIAKRTRLNLNAERAAGDSSYAIWKFEAGPAFELRRGRTLTLTYSRLEDTDNAVTNGASAELEGPMIPDKLSASGSLAYSKHETLSGFEGTAGLSWTPFEHVELEGDAGYTETGISQNSVFSTKHVTHGNQKQGRNKVTSTTIAPEDAPGVTALLAVRLSFP